MHTLLQLKEGYIAMDDFLFIWIKILAVWNVALTIGVLWKNSNAQSHPDKDASSRLKNFGSDTQEKQSPASQFMLSN